MDNVLLIIDDIIFDNNSFWVQEPFLAHKRVHTFDDCFEATSLQIVLAIDLKDSQNAAQRLDAICYGSFFDKRGAFTNHYLVD
jgi:hypothetical protein